MKKDNDISKCISFLISIFISVSFVVLFPVYCSLFKYNTLLSGRLLYELHSSLHFVPTAPEKNSYQGFVSQQSPGHPEKFPPYSARIFLLSPTEGRPRQRPVLPASCQIASTTPFQSLCQPGNPSLVRSSVVQSRPW